ncbi:hypothetical protein BGM19_07060 [Streptomyces agglomeratus]|uniref:hypothetical protein n=1 Tax=Streptomyces agglomeratus TaxID=285458 RepID=UPI00086DFE6D|nr:hypothetical protein [Streptomyces agglomeratus]OEJ57764.1 hypothetical protein BGM19_07060 [Streptomyces agglomeratus]
MSITVPNNVKPSGGFIAPLLSAIPAQPKPETLKSFLAEHGVRLVVDKAMAESGLWSFGEKDGQTTLTVPPNANPVRVLEEVRPAVARWEAEKRETASTGEPTIDRLCTAPLGELIAETNVQLIDSSIDDESFFGAVVVRPRKRTVLLMPTQRSEIENDVITRYLIGQSFGMDLTPLPKPFGVAVHPLIDGVAA